MVSSSLVRHAPRLLILAGLLTLATLLSFGSGKGTDANEHTQPTELPNAVEEITQKSETKQDCFTYEFKGTQCMSKGTTLPDQCEFEFNNGKMKMNFCDRKDRCAQWAGGTYHSTPSKCTTRVENKCNSAQLTTELIEKGLWDAEQKVFSVPGCSLQSYTRHDILNLLKGKRILITGDSMMRQVFLRLIDILRGQPYSIEHYYHTDSYYVSSYTDDKIVVGITSEKAPNVIADKVFEMYYFWDHHPSKFKKIFEWVKPDIHIASFMYWWKGREPFTDIDKYMKTIVQYAKVRGPDYKYFYLTTPWTKKGTFGGVEDERRIPRNEYMIDLLTSLSSKADVKNTKILDFASYAAVKHFNKTGDGIHYMCIWRPEFPKQIKIKDSKFKPDGCEDPVGANWARLMLNVLDTS